MPSFSSSGVATAKCRQQGKTTMGTKNGKFACRKKKNDAKNIPQKSGRVSASGMELTRGSRGGLYYMNSKGKKVYVKNQE